MKSYLLAGVSLLALSVASACAPSGTESENASDVVINEEELNEVVENSELVAEEEANITNSTN